VKQACIAVAAIFAANASFAYIDLEDAHVSGGGAVGLWTKADSVTAFDDFSYGAK